MPVLPTRLEQPSPVSANVEMPPEFPAIPQSILDRFPDAADWQDRLDTFWQRSSQAIQVAQQQTASFNNSRVTFSVDTFRIYAKNGIPQPMFALDATGVRIGDVLVINTAARKMYIGAGNYANNDTPFYIDTIGRFSLGANLQWDPSTSTLTITGTINATSGTIGGFTIGATTLSATAGGTTTTIDSTVPDIHFLATSQSTSLGLNSLAMHNPATTLSLSPGGLAFSSTAGTSGFYSISGFSLKAFTGQPTVSFGLGSVTNAFAITTTSGNPILEFGADTNIYRSSANTLKTDDAMMVTGALTVGASGTGANAEQLIISGGSSAGGGGILYFSRNSVVKGQIGNDSAIFGTNSDDIGILAATSGNVNIYANGNATAVGVFSSSGLKLSGLAGVGTRNVVADASGNLSAP